MSTSTPRSGAEFDLLVRRLGTDLRLRYSGAANRYGDADLDGTVKAGGARSHVDLAVVDRVDAARQLLVNRLQTRKGELAQLGHPEYGSRHHELIGEPNTERTRNLVKLYILDSLRREPRVAEVTDCTITTTDDRRDVVRVALTIRLIDEPNELNLVVPFDLSGGEAGR